VPGPWIRRSAAIALAAATALGGVLSWGQEPIDLRGRLDVSPGGTLLGNRPGPSIGRTPPSAYQRLDLLPTSRPDRLLPPPTIPDFPLPLSPSAPATEGLLGDPDGISLAEAIEQMIHCNPNIASARSEIEQARADIITAGLRANPQFFTDMQQIPYRVLGPNQVDVNVAYPMDVSGKRRARIKSAMCVLRSIEWRYRDFVRIQIDNLYTVFIDALAARQTLIEFESGAPPPSVRLDETQASPVDEAKSTLRDKRLSLAVLLSLDDPNTIKIKGLVYDPRTYNRSKDDDDPESLETLQVLKRIAWENRPDLNAKRWDLQRAMADVAAIRAGRLDDVTFLAQPFTYATSIPKSYGWAVGITIPMPLYNRQQGNLAKAEEIVAQTRAQLAALEHSVAAEVQAAYNEIRDTYEDTKRFHREVRKDRKPELPHALPDDASLKGNIEHMNKYIFEMKQKDLERARRNLYNTIIRHRKSLLRMNTACGCNVVPFDDRNLLFGWREAQPGGGPRERR